MAVAFTLKVHTPKFSFYYDRYILIAAIVTTDF